MRLQFNQLNVPRMVSNNKIHSSGLVGGRWGHRARKDQGPGQGRGRGGADQLACEIDNAAARERKEARAWRYLGSLNTDKI